MASKKRKVSETECGVSGKKIKNPGALKSPTDVLSSGVTTTPISDGGESSKTLSLSSLSKFSSLCNSDDSWSKFLASTKESVNIELPESVSVLKFAECRASEISSLMQAVETKRCKLVFQQLPNYMRRRAASHNANRVPRRLREKVLKEIEDAKKLKRPSRKHRRRPSNLLQEYNRRQRTHTWLETHIWFAKRFKIAELWGYKIPLHPNDKSVKAGYRASSQHALIQDLSYMCCVELVGLEQNLLQKLSKLTSVSTGLTFASKMCLTGTREGHVMLYNCQSFPHQPLGPVSFLWCPHNSKSLNDGLRKLWVWCHPAMHNELIRVLKFIFDLLNDQEELSSGEVKNVSTSKGDHDAPVTSGESALAEKENPHTIVDNDPQKYSKDKSFTACDKKLNFRFKRTTCFSNNQVSITLLKDALVRHRLIGPLSHAVITDALKSADVECNITPVAGDIKWWETFYNIEENHISHQEQIKFWSEMQQLKSPDEASPKIVLGLTVKDPRLDLPKMQQKMSYEFNGHKTNGGFVPNISPELSSSPIWQEAIRNEITATKVPESQLNKQRSKFLIPGTRLELGRDESRIPIIAIQQPGVNGYASGWDIIAPLGWSMAFWIAFIYRGARAFGLRELRSISREAGVPLFPFNYPDTHSGKEWEETNRKALMTKHFRYPPKKRPSFLKLGILAPFFMPWETLVANWIKQLSKATGEFNISETNLSYFVLRAKKELRQLSEICGLLTKLSKQKNKNAAQSNVVKKYLEEFKTKVQDSNLKNALVCIKLTSSNKGNPSEYSGVYMPSDSDLLMLKRDSTYRGPVEPVHSVPQIKCDKQKKRRRKKKKEGASLKLTEKKKIVQSIEEDPRVLRPNVKELINHCSHQLMGLIEVGDFSILKGCGAGFGHCSLVALLKTLRKCYDLNTRAAVLVRSQNGFQYRFMNIDIFFC